MSGFDSDPRQDASAARLPLIDIHIHPESASADASTSQTPGRRKRLSDAEPRTDDPRPQPKSHRRRLSWTATGDRDKPASESGSPDPINRQSCSATLERPQTDAETGPADDIIDLAATARARPRFTGSGSRRSPAVVAAGGLLAALAGVLLWTVVAAVTNLPVTWMAVGMGMLVGGSIRVLAPGLDKSFGRLGAGITLFSCILGNCLANCAFVAHDAGLSITSVLAQIGPRALPRLIAAGFHPLDLLFYGPALYLGYRLSFRRLPRAR